jgi:hypothetical protein
LSASKLFTVFIKRYSSGLASFTSAEKRVTFTNVGQIFDALINKEAIMKRQWGLVFVAASLFSSGAMALPIIIGDATYSTSSYSAPSHSDDYSLYMIGVYETRSDHSFGYHPTGTATVNIESQAGRDTVLVLSSYEPTLWNIVGAGVADISRVLIFGYHDQSVSGLNGSTLLNEYSYLGTNNYMGSTYSYPGNGQVTGYLSSLGLSVSEFAGSYRATQFEISALSTSVPEPTTLALFGIGLVGLGLRRKIKR